MSKTKNTWKKPTLVHVDIADCKTGEPLQSQKCAKKGVSPACQSPTACNNKPACNPGKGGQANFS